MGRPRKRQRGDETQQNFEAPVVSTESMDSHISIQSAPIHPADMDPALFDQGFLDHVNFLSPNFQAMHADEGLSWTK